MHVEVREPAAPARKLSRVTPAIEVRGLHVTYRRGWRGRPLHAVRGLDLQVEPGEVVGFIGRNGAGKSSTINSLMGFLEPSAGEVSLLGIPSADPASRRGVGYLPEVALYYPWLTAMETLQLYGELEGLRGGELRRRAGEMLERVGLAGREGERLQRFSKGMLQRVGIAQALLGNPRLLILDEVTSGLDPVGRRDARDLLLEQREAGVSIFFSSHELTEVAQLCDRIIVVHGGRVIAEEELGDLMRRLERFTLSAALPPGNDPPRAGGRVLRGRWSAEFTSVYDRDLAAAELEKAGYLGIDRGRQEGDLEAYFVELVQGQVS